MIKQRQILPSSSLSAYVSTVDVASVNTVGHLLYRLCEHPPFGDEVYVPHLVFSLPLMPTHPEASTIYYHKVDHKYPQLGTNDYPIRNVVITPQHRA